MLDDLHLALIHADRRRLVRAATRLLGPADAEDAVQDACVRALEADTPALHTAPAWLLTVMRNVAIDRLRRRQWMRQWLADMDPQDPAGTTPSAEATAALAEEVGQALRLMARHLSPSDGAAVLLHEVFEVGHAEIARASGCSEAGSRQQLRRALQNLRQAAAPVAEGRGDGEFHDDTVLKLYVQSLRSRDPRALWAMLRQPPIRAIARQAQGALPPAGTSAPEATCGIVQMAGQLGLVLTLDGITLCVVPLGVRPDPVAQETA